MPVPPRRQWGSARGCRLPIQCVVDVLGNVYNAQTADSLGGVSASLTKIVIDSEIGPAVDMDALLLLLVEEYQSGAGKALCVELIQITRGTS